MELDIKLDEWKCPHCGEDAAEVTYIEISNKEYERSPRGGHEWKFYPKARSVVFYLVYECGGETGYQLEASTIDCTQYDGETQNRCAQLAVR